MCAATRRSSCVRFWIERRVNGALLSICLSADGWFFGVTLIYRTGRKELSQGPVAGGRLLLQQLVPGDHYRNQVRPRQPLPKAIERESRQQSLIIPSELLSEARDLEVLRYELPNLRAQLRRRRSARRGRLVFDPTDPQAKSLGEYPRAKLVDLSEELLADTPNPS